MFYVSGPKPCIVYVAKRLWWFLLSLASFGGMVARQ